MVSSRRLALEFLLLAAVLCLGLYLAVGLAYGSSRFMFQPSMLLVMFGPMLLPALAGAVYLLLARSTSAGMVLVTVILAAAVVFAVFYFWLLTIENPVDRSYAALPTYPIVAGGIVAAIVAALLGKRVQRIG